MRRNVKKLITLLFAVALMAGCLLMTTEAQATPRSIEKKDAKNGILWESAVRIYVGNQIDEASEFFFTNPEYYVASVKSSSKNLIAKKTWDYKSNSGSVHYDDATKTDYYRRSNIEFFAKKKGTYTVTVTIKNAMKKVVAKKKIKVYAGYPNFALESLSYAGTKLYLVGGDSTLCTSTASSNLKLKANATYKIKKIEVANTYENDGTPKYRKIKNGAKIKLATKTTFEKIWYDSDTYRTGCKYNFLKPMTMIRVTIRDKKLKTTFTEEHYIFNVK